MFIQRATSVKIFNYSMKKKRAFSPFFFYIAQSCKQDPLMKICIIGALLLIVVQIKFYFPTIYSHPFFFTRSKGTFQ